VIYFKKIKVLLTTGERRRIYIALVARILSTGLDILGLVVVGVVVSILSGTVISKTSLLGQVLTFIAHLGIPNAYALLVAVAITLFLLKGIVSVFIGSKVSGYVSNLEANIASDLFSAYLRGGLRSARPWSQVRLQNALSNSLHSLVGIGLTTFVALVGEFTLLLAISTYLALTDFLLFLLMGIFFGLIGVIMNATVGQMASKIGERQHKEFLHSQGVVSDVFENYKQMVTLRRTGDIQTLYFARRYAAAHAGARYSIIATLPRYITEFAVMIAVGLLAFSRSGIFFQAPSASVIAVFVAGIFRIVASMLPLQSAVTTLERVLHEGQPALKMLNTYPRKGGTLSENKEVILESHNSGQIFIDDLAFRYPGAKRAIFSSFSTSIESGTVALIKGKSGQGKSTFADLLLGLLEPTAGTLKVGGREPAQNIAHDGDVMVGYVPQKTSLVHGTLAENISMSFGSHPIDEERLEAVLHLACLDDLASQLPDGINTLLGSGMALLSGGQIQRVGLARTMYHKPRIVILDESTSALDEETELNVIKNLISLPYRPTLLFISHSSQVEKYAEMTLEFTHDGIKVSPSQQRSSTPGINQNV
jgi:ABC-type multidrug transport system fused ATPase/permease subunit